MKFLRDVLDRQEPHFMKGGKFEKFYALYEMIDTFLYTPGEVTKNASHVRDAIDLKRMMITVVVALTPAIIMALYNTGFQANQALASSGIAASGWRSTFIEMTGIGFDPASITANMIHGALYFIPIFQGS